MNHRVLSILSAIIVSFAVTASRAMAHPGHGLDTTDVGLLHFLLHPSHGGLVIIVAIVLVAASIVRKLRRPG